MSIQTPASHRNDPETSFEAEQHMNESGKRQIQQQQVLLCVKRFGGRTSAELAELSGLDRAMIARRLPELATGGLVNRGVKVKCRVNGTQAVTWWEK